MCGVFVSERVLLDVWLVYGSSLSAQNFGITHPKTPALQNISNKDLCMNRIATADAFAQAK